MSTAQVQTSSLEAADGEFVVRAVDVSKSFGGARALSGVSLDVRLASCHAVIGENGAGKSTLMRILCGELLADAGQVVVNGETLGSGGVRAARKAGIAIVHQELSLVPEMSVAENISLGSPASRAGFIRSNEQRAVARELLERVGVDLDVDVDEPVRYLPLATRQFVEIAKALRKDPSVLVVDEPTASLTPRETERLHGLLRELQGRGMAIIYISHRLPEIYSLCSQASVLRDGQKVGEVSVSEVTSEQLIHLMVGRELQAVDEVDREATIGEQVLRAKGIRAPGVHDVDFEVHKGEILGLGGLVGAGRSELVRAMLNIDAREAGEVKVRNGDSWSTLRSYSQAIGLGIAFVPEDRRKDGVALELSVAENLSLPSIGDLSRLGFQQGGLRRALVDRLIKEVGIRVRGPERPAGDLSGGNQQKVAVGKWLPKSPSVMVLDEPTCGVDVGAKAEIHRQIRAIADAGAAVVLISSELPELLALSDRVLVLREGRIAGSLSRAEATSQDVMKLATVASTSGQSTGREEVASG